MPPSSKRKGLETVGRNNKANLDYFPLDVHLDDKIELIEAEYGLKGFAIVVKLFQKIYGERGYYCEWNADVALLFGRKCGMGGNAVSEIVGSCVKRGLFDAEQFNNNGILTSHGIQKTYIEACEKRKVVDVKAEYLLLEKSEISKNVVINGIKVGINEIDSGRNPQSKSKSKSKSISSSINTEENENPFGNYSDNRPNFDTVEVYVSNNISRLGMRAMQELESFKEDLPEEIIRYAVDEACDHDARNWAYVKRILNDCLDNGYRTVGDIEAARAKKNKKPSSTDTDTSEVKFFGR